MQCRIMGAKNFVFADQKVTMRWPAAGLLLFEGRKPWHIIPSSTLTILPSYTMPPENRLSAHHDDAHGLDQPTNALQC